MVIISEPADGRQLVTMTVMGKREGGTTINHCRYLESLGAFSHRRERRVPAHQDELLQELISAFWLGSAPQMLPSWLDWGFRGPLGLSNSHQITNGPCCIPYTPTCMVSPPPLLWLWNSPGSVGMNQFCLFVAMSGFCQLSVPKQLNVGSDRSQRQHKERGGAQEQGLDCLTSHYSLSQRGATAQI